MKAYELMALLSECPAGEEVEFHSIIGVSELQSGSHCEGDAYCYNCVIGEVERDTRSGKVFLYG